MTGIIGQLAWHPSIKLQECETEAGCRPQQKKKKCHSLCAQVPSPHAGLSDPAYSCPNVHAFWTSLQRPTHSSVVTGETPILGSGFGWGWEPHNVIPPYISSLLKTKILYKVSCMCWSLLYLRLQLRFILVPIAWYVAQYTLKLTEPGFYLRQVTSGLQGHTVIQAVATSTVWSSFKRTTFGAPKLFLGAW